MADAALQEDLLGPELGSYVETQKVLLSAAHHDIGTLRSLLKSVPATVRDPETGYTAVHSAIAACASSRPDDSSEDVSIDIAKAAEDTATDQHRLAEETLKLLFQNGAIWNDLDSNNETAGCLAWRLDIRSLYDIVVDAGVRAELLLNRLDDFEPLPDSPVDNDDDAELELSLESGNEAVAQTSGDEVGPEGTPDRKAETVHEEPLTDESTHIENYLSSSLSFTPNRILDSAANGVMMSWETSLMHQTAHKVLPSPGLSILNIGFGMGIFDTSVQDELAPASHHIVEAHPDILGRMTQTGWDSSSSTCKRENVTVHAGTWQDVLPQLVSQNITFDAIFFDTFAEDYKAFREFFSEHVIGLLKPEGRWSFFHGLGADRQVCYDVYTKVVEMDLLDAGFEVEWEDVELPELIEEGTEASQWDGVKRTYFSVEKYRLPVCSFMG